MGITVLIVDDSSMTRLMIERAVRAAEEKVDACYQAANGREAMDVLEEHPVDLVFTDLHMSEMDGRHFIQKLRASTRWTKVPVVVVTSEQSRESEAELFRIGATCWQSKPVTPNDVREILLALKESKA